MPETPVRRRDDEDDAEIQKKCGWRDGGGEQ